MPSLLKIGSYVVYFWSNENNEPIHVHISMGVPSQNGTKIWITSAGGCVVAKNTSRIPQKDLNVLLDIISAQYFMICSEWKRHFNVDTINYYC